VVHRIVLAWPSDNVVGYISRVKRLLQLKQNNAKQIQNKPQKNKTKLFCFGFLSALRTCEAKRCNKTEVGVAYLSIKVLTSLSNTPPSSTLRHALANSDAPRFNAGVDICDTTLSNLLILSCIVASDKSIKIFYYYSITSFGRNSLLPSLPISM